MKSLTRCRHRRVRRLTLLAVGAALATLGSTTTATATATAASAHRATLLVTNLRMPVPTNSSEGAVYMTIRNMASKPVAVISASISPTIATSAVLHNEVLHGQAEVMIPIARLVIPANKSVVLAPGGYHLMVMGLHTSLKVGQSVPVVLHLSNGSSVSITAPVVTLAQAFGHGVGKASSGGSMPGMNMKGMG